MTLHAYPLTSSWDEGTGVSNPATCPGDGATWYETTGGHSWSSQGGDFDASTASSQVSIAANEAPQWDSFDVSSLVSKWVSGQAPNLGFLFNGPASFGQTLSGFGPNWQDRLDLARRWSHGVTNFGASAYTWMLSCCDRSRSKSMRFAGSAVISAERVRLTTLLICCAI